MIKLVLKVDGALRHLRNYAKKRIQVKHQLLEMTQLITELYKWVQSTSESTVTRQGLKKQDLTEFTEIIRRAFSTPQLQERAQLFQWGTSLMSKNYKNQKFFSQVCSEVLEVQKQ